MEIIKVEDKSILKFDKVEMKEASVEDEKQAFIMSGVDRGYDFQLALIAVLCTFDGKKYVMEDLKKLSRADFGLIEGAYWVDYGGLGEDVIKFARYGRFSYQDIKEMSVKEFYWWVEKLNNVLEQEQKAQEKAQKQASK